MANYHLLPSKEHNDEEEEEETGNATPSPASTESKLWKRISIFLAVCIIAITSFIAGRRFNSPLSSNDAAFTEDLSFLSTYNSQSTDHLCQIPAHGALCYLSRPSRPHHQNLHQRPQIQTTAFARERRSMAFHSPEYVRPSVPILPLPSQPPRLKEKESNAN